MTSHLANDARIGAKIINGVLTPALVDKRTGHPAEGQWPHTWAQIPTGALSAAFDNFPELNVIVNGTAIALSDAQLKNLVGRRIVFKCNAFGVTGTTVTLSGALKFNEGATNIATFSTTLESCIELYVTATAANVVQVNVVSLRNVVLS